MRLYFYTRFEEIVLLDGEGWEHIQEGHPEVTKDMVTETLVRPDLVTYSYGQRQVYFAQGAHLDYPDHWGKVIVDYCPAPPIVVTAMVPKRLSKSDLKGGIRYDGRPADPNDV